MRPPEAACRVRPPTGRALSSVGIDSEPKTDLARAKLPTRDKPRVGVFERRWASTVALLVVFALNAGITGNETPLMRWGVTGLVVVLLVPSLILNPRRYARSAAWAGPFTLVVTAILVLINQVNVGHLVNLLLDTRVDGRVALGIAARVWLSNAILFALLFWELDRGGPVRRRSSLREELPQADFLFPQDDMSTATVEVAVLSTERADWRPVFFDYFYISASNMMALTPADALPISPRSKLLMLIESFAGYIILALVISRSVSLLSQLH